MKRAHQSKTRAVDDSPLLAGIRYARRTTPTLVAVPLALALVVGSARAASMLLYGVWSISDAPPLVEDGVFYLSMFGLALALLFLWVRLYERRDVRSLLGETARPAGKVLRGVLVGLALASGTVLVLAVAGAASFEAPSNGTTWFATLGGAAAAMVFSWAFPAAAEEVIARGWLLQNLGARHGVAAAVIVSSLTFALWHWLLDTSLGPLPVFNLMLLGVFWCLYALREGSLLGVCVAHASYNWAESNLFGFDFFGNEPIGGSLMNLKETGPDVLTGGGVGINTTGGLAFSLVTLAGIVALLLLARTSP